MIRTNALRALAALALLLLAAGCARPPAATLPAPQAEQVWTRFIEGSKGQDAPAFRLSASLLYADQDQQRRLTAQFYGNFDYPLRMDLSAGIGALVSSWREDARGFVAYYPQEGVAFVEPGSAGSALSQGLPLGLRDLALMANGRWAELFPQGFEAFEPTDAGELVFHLADNPLAETITLGRTGQPLALSSPDGRWLLRASTAPEAPWRPGKLRLTSANGERVILNLKELEPLNEVMSAEDLRLDLPPETRLQSLPAANGDNPSNLL